MDDVEAQVAKMTNLLASLKMKQSAASAIASATKLEKPVKKNALEFKRVDQVYDIKIRDWKLVESNKDAKDEFDCVFTVRRRLNWEGKYQETQVDIKSKVLRNCLQAVFKDCKSISLVEDTPQVDPHTLFHYYDELKSYVKKELKPKLRKARKAREKKLRTQQVAQCRLLLKYLDEDYTSVRKALKPMLKAGTITYDLVWALFKPNTIAFTPTYGNKDDPRCFRVDFSYEYESWLTQAKSLVVDGRYLEYDGKAFGLGDHQVQIQAFKGHKRITSLSAYPLKYHKDPDGIKKQLVQRGMKFVALQGMNYRLQKGIAYMKVKNSVIRFNINGRVMIDPEIFRRINPNYQLSYIKHDELNQDEAEDDEDDSDDCCCSASDADSDKGQDKLRTVMWKDRKGKKWPIKLPQSVIEQEAGANSNAKLEGGEDEIDNKRHVFTEEELLIASPVVLGFAFSEKYWLEFSLSGIDEIKWNAEAFDSLVLGDRIKQNLKGLVSSHRFNAAKTIDDVIQGKGKGLNVVLHGPPGVGKTLTGESIAEYLKCPLYAVSAGELGTNSRSLEQDLNRIMDITHSWGAILLLDEADVFLEARQPHDIHRNSLVSVFLRLTEYYQGILFLTTNRVETFDEAFQSRIHMGIRYENLQPKARKKIWQHHVGKVEEMAEMAKGKDESKVKPFTESDFDELSKRNMNGRQIKNTVKTSQSIALAEKAAFGMEHVKRVLEVAEAFEDDMRGGKGYRDAMRHYT
ncbi:P-loop containing nucleoside triphosphate hydrolase protein [Paraphoma chrysanthemicola]|uniref:P-loop containing nucleoside triphosphate hydrolase protein n=1 Tax=Paraphoma chrysanthemicola TaxID=798071 RepID=A0A8K0R480_9PLEO|nr:P-loop containing nucleoside triphosphate hydrolase protein [Paraphoma chrysanthemicola]